MTTIKPYPYPLSKRNPHPFPKLENDEDFRGRLYVDLQRTRRLPTGIAHIEEPWNRINRHHTLASLRHEVCYTDSNAPRDSLDFIIKSVYRHGVEFLKDKNEVLLQKETLGLKHGRILKNRTYHIQAEPPILGHPLRVSVYHRRDHPNSVHVPVWANHSLQSNFGYSRKTENGNIFTH